MKKLLSSLLLLLFSLVLLNNKLSAHSVQVAYSWNCQGDLRLYVEHWHSSENPATTTMTLQLTVGGTVTNITGSPAGSLLGVTLANLPTPATVFAFCPNDANTYNDWVYYDFPGAPCNVPISIKVISGNTVFTQDGCNMYPATASFTIPCAAPIIVPNQTVCAGTQFAPTNFPVVPGVIYSWTNSNTAIGLPASGSGNIPAFTAGSVSSTQTATITIGTNGCPTNSTFTLTVKPQPTLVITNPPGVCIPNTVDITTAAVTAGSANVSSLTYWSDAAGTIPLTNPNAINTSGTYYIQATNPDGCTDTKPVVVAVNPLPNLIINDPPPVCHPGTVDITLPAVTAGTVSMGVLSYWTDASAATSLASPNSINTSGIYYIKITTPEGCTDIKPVNVTIAPLPVLTINNPASACFPSTVDITAPAVTSGTTGVGVYTYWLDAAATIPLANPNAVASSGTYYIQITTALGCTDIRPVVVVINPQPTTNFVVDVPKGCPKHCVNFSDLSSVTGGLITGWNWNFGDGQTDNQQNPSYCYSKSGFYSVSLTVTSDRGCSKKLIIPDMIEVYPQPVADYFGTPNPVSVSNPKVTFIDQSTKDVVYWEWDFGDGTTYHNTTTPNPTHEYPAVVDMSYLSQLIVKNGYGCKDTAVKPMVVGSEFTFYVPNAFTPNGDGKNDEFYAQGVGIAEYDMWIFDRWGNMIFHGTNINAAWDGKVKGGTEVAQQDVYVWKVVLKNVFGITNKYTGTVTLVR